MIGIQNCTPQDLSLSYMIQVILTTNNPSMNQTNGGEKRSHNTSKCLQHFQSLINVPYEQLICAYVETRLKRLYSPSLPRQAFLKRLEKLDRTGQAGQAGMDWIGKTGLNWTGLD